MEQQACCTKNNRTNNYRLVPLLLPITYESADIMKTLILPRKYTSTHNDETRQVFVSIGHEYNKYLLDTEEVKNVESQVLGYWTLSKKNTNKYEIHLKVLVSTEKNPQAEIRNKVFCEELGYVLEGIAFAEISLLTRYPKLGNARIYIHFKSPDPKYERTEYWHKLAYWLPKSTKKSLYNKD